METIADLGSYTFPSLLANSIRKFGDRPAITLINGTPYTYKQIGEKSFEIAKMIKGLGLEKGSKIAILSTGRPEWGLSYFAIVSYGMIAVPLLPDFSETEISAIYNHCGIDAIFVESRLLKKVENITENKAVIQIDDFKILKCENPDFINKSLEAFSDVEAPVSETKEEDTASIIYTSGTTGRSKGVELTHKNLVWTCIKCQSVHQVKCVDRTLSFLPLSHVYEFTVSFSMQLLNGACIYYLGKPPVVSTLLPAFKIVQPTIVLSVPLIMEKIYKNTVLPTLTKNNFMKTIYKVPVFRKLLHVAAGKKLMKTFGGHLTFFGIGGAKVDPAVEEFMKEAKFPYAIGYGLTETSPLLAGSGPKITVPGAIGLVMEGVEIQIANPNAEGVGEIVAKGENVMKGYYKDEALTKEVFTTEEDSCGPGYFKTGDLGIFIKKNGQDYLVLKGRNKNMILGPSGENIYPEDIEFILNQHPIVSESLVVEDDNGLVALVQVDEEKLEAEAENRVKASFASMTEAAKNMGEAFQKSSTEFINEMNTQRKKILSEIQTYVNSKVNKSSKINKVEQIEKFEKTATQKIKRYLYDLRTKVHGKNEESSDDKKDSTKK